MRTELLQILSWLWSAFGVYWIGTAFLQRKSKPAGDSANDTSPRSGEFPFYRVLRISILLLTFALLFGNWTAVGILKNRLLPDSAAPLITGFSACLLGFTIAIWARVHLGRYWSDKVVLQEDHRLIRSGPYAYMRHPIYTGVLLGVAGTAIVVGEVRGFVAFFLLVANYWIKARKEEKILGQQFGEEFRLHQARAGFLLPRLRGQ